MNTPKPGSGLVQLWVQLLEVEARLREITRPAPKPEPRRLDKW